MNLILLLTLAITLFQSAVDCQYFLEIRTRGRSRLIPYIPSYSHRPRGRPKGKSPGFVILPRDFQKTTTTTTTTTTSTSTTTKTTKKVEDDWLFDLRDRSLNGEPEIAEREAVVDEQEEIDGGAISRGLPQEKPGVQYAPEPLDTDAKHGDPCNPTSFLDWDFCERAKYPNKGRMVCASADLDPKNAGTCICKFYKMEKKDDSLVWKQLKYDEKKGICVSPEGGVCYVKFHNNTFTDDMKELIYFKDEIAAHDQCDDPVPWNDKKRKLLCSQPHPRRFPVYDKYHHYCLSKKNRNVRPEKHGHTNQTGH